MRRERTAEVRRQQKREHDHLPNYGGDGGPDHAYRGRGTMKALVRDFEPVARASTAFTAVVEAGADPVVVMAIADREDPDAAAFRADYKVECLVTLSEIRAK